ncbi:MAG TPA: hypothetical protein VN258_18555, partial [Mobilitalea sp.]|nr:hypothetical protein [Mobilitalea sp.]
IFVIAREGGVAVGCGAFRELSNDIAEIKRMYARKNLAVLVTKFLPIWKSRLKNWDTIELSLRHVKCNENAVIFYLNNVYQVINNYGKYKIY